jgi:hypothetical protein
MTIVWFNGIRCPTSPFTTGALKGSYVITLSDNHDLSDNHSYEKLSSPTSPESAKVNTQVVESK